MIPKRFIRVWLGGPIPAIFDEWWDQFKALHPDWDFVTIGEKEAVTTLPIELREIWSNCSCYAAQSDLARLVAVARLGGIYVDTDFMPLRAFDKLLDDPRPFAGLRSSKSFANGLFASPANHPVILETIKRFPIWYKAHQGKSASVQTGPAQFSEVWFGRKDVRHLPPIMFYPYNGFMSPNREERIKIFKRKEFPPEMFAAHFGNHRWGGKPVK